MASFLKTIILFTLVFVSINDEVIKLSGKPDLFTTDKLGCIYTYNENLLSKFDADGKLIGQYSNYDSGRLHSIDASDPMQILLFYKDFNMIVFLDNKLIQLGKPVYIDGINFNSVSSVCKSKQYAIWLYDEYEHKLIQYGFNPHAIIQNFNLDKMGKEIGRVETLQEIGNEIIIKDNFNVLWIFDQFGRNLNKIELTITSDFQIRINTLIFNNNKLVYLYNLHDDMMDSIKLEGFEYFDQARIENELFYVLNNDSIVIAPLKKEVLLKN